MTKAVVTGGAGFIGSHLAEELTGRGYAVTIIDDLSSGKKENILPLLKKPGVSFVKGSITDLSLLEKLFQDVTYIFHQAALTRVPQSISDPLKTHETNITGTLNVLMAARKNAVKKVIFASSAAVYGSPVTVPQSEDMPADPLSPYAVSKLAGEQYCAVFRRVYNLNTVSLRYFNVYGTKQDPDSTYASVILEFLKKISRDLPPVIFGDGEQTRDFVSVFDVVRANILAAESDASGVYNIGSGKSTTINQLAITLTKIAGKKLAPVYQAPRQADPRYSLADISKARGFGYQPEYALEKGLQQMMQGISK